MCFAIPLKVKKIVGDLVEFENGRKAKRGEFKIREGEYYLVFGDMIVEKVEAGEAVKTRKAIKSLLIDKS